MTPPVIPTRLRMLKTWLVWKLIQKPGEKKPRKVPFYVSGEPREGGQGTDADRGLLTTFDKACAALAAGRYTGLGLAVLPDCGIVALDFDHCVDSGVVDPRIAALIAGTYSEVSPSGTGVRAFYEGALRSRKDNADKKDRNADGSRLDGKFDVEFFGSTGFVTVTGNATDDCDLMGLQDTVARLSPEVLALYRERFSDDGALVPFSSDADMMSLVPSLGWSLEQARQVLFECDPGAPRDTWLKALMAVHHEFGGSPEALDLVADWSAGFGAEVQPENYGGRAAVESAWRSLGRSNSGVVTGQWLLKWHREQVGQRGYEARQQWVRALNEAPDEFNIREKVCPQISKDLRLDEMGREALAQVLFEAFKRTGTKFPIAQCRKLLAERRVEKQRSESPLPTWLDGWVYVTDKDSFYRMDSDEWLTMQGFNARFNRELPVGEDGSLTTSAVWAALTSHAIPTVTRGIYIPWAEPMFDMDGINCVNTYRPSSVPVAAGALDADGRRAVAVVMRHLRLLCNNRADVLQTFVDWLAHNVQHPGVKIRWAPLMKGIEGDGKTVIGSLLASVMGRVNVHNVSPKVLGTDFTGWAEGSAVVVLEEIKLTGHNRYDILNALKPFVTNDSTEVHRKGQDGYDSINTTNYIAFTNYADALPLTDTDRRWWIVFTPFTDSTALAAAIGSGRPRDVLSAYFDELHDAIQRHRSMLRRWLLDHQISQSFKPNSAAPMTEEKTLMIGMSMTDEEHSVREALEKGGVGVTKDIFLSTHLRNLVTEMGTPLDANTTAWSRLLVRLGYTRQAKKLKWRGRTENVWVRGHRNMEPDRMRLALLGTLPEGVSDEAEDLF